MRLSRLIAQRPWRLAALAGAGVAATATAVHCHQGYVNGSAAGKGEGSDSANGKRLLLGVPKKGRMHTTIIEMLNGSGFNYKRPDRLDIAHCTDIPVSIVFLPAADIATYVAEGNVDLGITGEDIVAESGSTVNVLMELGFGKCRLSVQAPTDAHITDPRQLAGKRIVTSFPSLTEAFFKRFETPETGTTNIKCISGSVEAACGLGLADGIVDLVETGTTMRAAGLEEVSTVLSTQCVLIANPSTEHKEMVEVIRRRLAGFLTASRFVMITYNVHRATLKQATSITPGKRSPSIMSLEDTNWVAVSALVEKKRAANIMDQLESIGATDILTTQLHSSRMGD